jgi:Fe-S cluster biogenesis protein NfuA
MMTQFPTWFSLWFAQSFCQRLFDPWMDFRMAQDAPADTQSVFERVEAMIARFRPAIQSDGGDVELVDVTEEGVVKIRLHGACVGCPSSSMTLHMGIERNLREKVPEVTAVEQVP